MADDVAITAGAGTTVATDDIGGRHFQRVKLTTGADGTATDVAPAAPVPVRPGTATATKSNYTITGSSGTVLASNANRVAATFWNDSTTIFYLDLSGGTASATSCTVKLLPDSYYELPVGMILATGNITGIGASATGTVRVTEWA